MIERCVVWTPDVRWTPTFELATPYRRHQEFILEILWCFKKIAKLRRIDAVSILAQRRRQLKDGQLPRCCTRKVLSDEPLELKATVVRPRLTSRS